MWDLSPVRQQRPHVCGSVSHLSIQPGRLQSFVPVRNKNPYKNSNSISLASSGMTNISWIKCSNLLFLQMVCLFLCLLPILSIGVSLYKLLAQGLWKGDFMCFGLLTWLSCGIFSHWGITLYHKIFYIEMFALWVCVILTKFSSLCTDFINKNKKLFNNFIALTLIFKMFVLALLWHTLCDVLILSCSQMFRYPRRNN